MQSSVRAVEAYRRSRLIDSATSDDDKLAPVYRLDEICATLRGSPVDIVREMLDYTLKRLEHKSPIVKQKTLRLIKYAAGKGGPDYRREMQRQAATIRQLFHYKGQLDALKGDALNKAVRDTAHETISAIFGSDEKSTTMEEVGKRIQGFGSSNYDAPSEEKKSMLSGLVGFGSSSIRHSISMISGSGSGFGGGDSGGSYSGGSYRGQSLRSSLTTDRERFEKEEIAPWNIIHSDDDEIGPAPTQRERKSGYGNGRSKNDERGGAQEERLLEGLTAPGGVRLQPSRDTVQSFLNQALKLDPVNLVKSLEVKLKAHSWQVRFKALCLIEASIRERDNRVLVAVVEMFEEDASAIADCLQSPQASLREKTKKVLDLLGSKSDNGHEDQHAELEQTEQAHRVTVEVPDLIDTREMNSLPETLSYSNKSDQVVATLKNEHSDLLSDTDWLNNPDQNVPSKESQTNLFASISVKKAENGLGNGAEFDLFSGLEVDTERREGNGAVGGSGHVENSNSALFDGLTVSEQDGTGTQNDLADLMGTVSTNTFSIHNHVSQEQHSFPSTNGLSHQSLRSTHSTSQAMGTNPSVPSPFEFQLPQQGLGVPLQASGMPFHQQMMYMNPSMLFPMGMVGPLQSNMILQQAFASGAMGLANMNGSFGQQQFAAGFAAMPRFGVAGLQSNNGSANYSDSFDFSSDPAPKYVSSVDNSKEEESKTKAFDFISEHVSAALGPRKYK